MDYDLRVFTGNTNRPLAEDICEALKTPLGKATVSRFPGGELTVAHISGIDTPVLVQAPDEPIHLKASDVRVSLGRRIRAAVLLAVSVFGTAMLIGAIVSILVVSAVLVIA